MLWLVLQQPEVRKSKMIQFPKVIAHRGGVAYAPENSLSAFKECLARGCTFIECDVRLSACKTPVLFHDDSLRRISNGRGLVAENILDDLKSLDIGRSFSSRFQGEKIVTLEEALLFFNQHKITANIELKPTRIDGEELVSQVLTTIMQHCPLDGPMPLLSSFDEKCLALLQSISPDLPCGLLLDKWACDWQKRADNLNCISVHLNNKWVTEEIVAEIKEQGFQVLVYTVNKKKRAEQLYSFGVDSVFSDRPDLLSIRTGWFGR